MEESAKGESECGRGERMIEESASVWGKTNENQTLIGANITKCKSIGKMHVSQL